MQQRPWAACSRRRDEIRLLFSPGSRLGGQRAGLDRFAEHVWPAPGDREREHGQGLNCRSLRSRTVGQKRPGAGRDKRRGGHFPRSGTKQRLEPGPGVIVGRPRRIAPRSTHDHRCIPCGGINRAVFDVSECTRRNALRRPRLRPPQGIPIFGWDKKHMPGAILTQTQYTSAPSRGAGRPGRAGRQ